jgi:hypothetical protein
MRFEGLLDRLFGSGSRVRDREPRKRKPKQSHVSLQGIIDSYYAKEDIQNMLDALDLPVSGNKDELIRRLLKELSGLSSKEVLDSLFNKDTLKEICEDFGLPTGGVKAELVHRISSEVLITKPSREKTPHATPTVEQLQQTEPETEDISVDPTKKVETSSNRLYDILDQLTSRYDIQRALARLGINRSGNKDELIRRLLIATDNSPVETLSVIPGDVLQYIADKTGVPRRRSREDQIDEILTILFNMPKPKTPASSDIVIEKAIVRDKGDTYERPVVAPGTRIDEKGYETLVGDIEKWIPHRRCRSEGEYQMDLYYHLERLAYRVRMEEGGTLADILVNDQFPIEVKKDPGAPEYDRALGQLIKHSRAYGSIVAVVCDVKRLDQFEDFKETVAHFLPNNARVIKK